jgi:SAM-dependent methyltransferase
VAAEPEDLVASVPASKGVESGPGPDEPLYGPEFFAEVDTTAEGSAQRILPLVVDPLAPRSVVDVGCGSGAWLVEAARLGIDDYLGVDGYTPTGSLRIPAERFLIHDLTVPLDLERRFDLVVCLEVAEHLPHTAADVLVESLARLGPAVLFSAAVPHQSGDNHVNEQWPEYWAQRFEANGFTVVDAIRPLIWRDPGVAWWYRQNTLLFCEAELIDRVPLLREARRATRDQQLSMVHPELHSWMARQRDELERELARQPSLREVLNMLPSSAANALKQRGRRPAS